MEVGLMFDKKYKAIVIDTETTGLNAGVDELLQVSIIDDEGKTLFNSYIKPSKTKSWDSAMAVNHITPEMVANAPYMANGMIIMRVTSGRS